MSSKIYIGRILHKAFGRNRSKGSVTTISHLPVLPVELWLVILEHTLDFFFSLDPAAEYIDNPAGVNNWLRAQGWEANVFRQRLILRQVCHTWCNFVDLPEIKHRFSFARVPDIAQSDTRCSVTVAELLQARRIEGSFGYLSGYKVAVIEQLRETAASGGTFEAEILTNIDASLSNFVVHTNSSAFPRLKALSISAYSLHPSGLLSAIAAHFPSLRFLSIRNPACYCLLHDSFHLPSLSTLIIESNIYGDLLLDDWSLPSLSHLQIGNIASFFDLQRLVVALPVLGRKLRVLGVTLHRGRIIRYINEGYYAQLMSQFWDYVPILQSLRFPLPLILSHPPPRHHPIRYLINSDVMPAPYGRIMGDVDVTSDNTDALIAFCLAAPALAVVRESHNWALARLRSQDGGFEYPELQGAYRDIDQVERLLQVSNPKVRLEDVNGKTAVE